MRNLLLLSNSTLFGSEYLSFAFPEIKKFLGKFQVTKVLFIPYALNDHEEYTCKVRKAFGKMGFDLYGIHKEKDPVSAVKEAEAIYVGGGNTFRLLKALYDNNLVEIIKHRVLEESLPYMGASAGTNVATVSICTTNDMPIVFPPTFKALELVPFNINPHYIDPDKNSTHMGETREDRIKQYHEVPDMPAVIGLREGSMLLVTGNDVLLKGAHRARIFIPNEDPKECDSESKLNFLLPKK